MISKELKVAVDKSIQRHEIKKADAIAILKAIEDMDVTRGVLNLLEDGVLEIHGIKNGEPTFIEAGTNCAS
jgi:hypothetical protein